MWLGVTDDTVGAGQLAAEVTAFAMYAAFEH
jgi:hypothetical protein